MFEPRKAGFLAFFIAAICATQSAAENNWSDREICRSATMAYFWLDELPTDSSDKDDLFGFRSTASNYYTCQVVGRFIHFAWATEVGEAMRSESTTFQIQGNKLTVTTDLMAQEFLSD